MGRGWLCSSVGEVAVHLTKGNGSRRGRGGGRAGLAFSAKMG